MVDCLKKNGLILSACFIVYLGICYPLFQGRLYSSMDFINEHFPRRAALTQSLSQGENGFWYHYIHRGHSALYNGEGGLLHPVRHLQCRLFDPVVSMLLEILLLHPLAALGMFQFLRFRGRSANSAIFGAALFTFSAYFTAHLGQMNHLWILAHLPWLALGLDQTLRGSPWKGPLLLGLTYVSMILLGHPQMVWLGSLALTLPAVLQGITMRWSKEYWQRVGKAALILAAAIMIGMIQLLPSIHGLRHSERGNLTPLERNNYSAHPQSLAQNFAPYLTMSTTVGDYFYFKDGSRDFLNNPSEFSVYFGLGYIVLMMAFLPFLWRGSISVDRAKWGTAITMVAILVLLSMGRYGGINSLLEYIPKISQFRCPNRYKLVLALWAAMFGAYMLDAVCAKTTHTSYRLKQYIVPSIPVVISILIFCYSFASGGIGKGHMVYHFAPLGQRAVGPCIALTVLIIFAFWLRLKSNWLLQALICVCILDLGFFGLLRIHMVPQKTISSFHQMGERFSTSKQKYRSFAINQMPLLDGELMANGFSGMPPKEQLDFRVASHRRLASINRAYTYIDGVWTHAEVPGALPRYRLVPNIKHAVDPIAEIETCDLTEVVYTKDRKVESLIGPGVEQGESIEFLQDHSDHLIFRVKVNHKRAFVLSDRWTPDWVARVNRQPHPCLSFFEGALRGVVVEPGTWQIEFLYDPPVYHSGKVISSAGGILFCILLIVFHFSGKRNRALV